VLHGDYWPGNVLWRDGRLVGVIGWEEAAFGDPLADLANILATGVRVMFLSGAILVTATVAGRLFSAAAWPAAGLLRRWRARSSGGIERGFIRAAGRRAGPATGRQQESGRPLATAPKWPNARRHTCG
jgi:aminoglycoside phosphotransferase (APT) family kinase protein